MLLGYLSSSGKALTANDTTKPLPVLAQTIDFLDNAYFTQGEYYTKEELYKRMKLAANAGIKKIYFRTVPGFAYYPSKVRRMFTGEARKLSKKLVRTINEYDVLQEYIKVAHELGMKLYYWEPVFDTEIYIRYSPGSKEHAKYGEFPFKDRKLKNEQQWKHRFADNSLWSGEIKKPIGKIKLLSKVPSKINSKNLIILTANADKPFRKYTGKFTVSIKPEKKHFAITIEGLNINKPCIKLANKVKNGEFFVVADLNTECASLTYIDGSPVNLLCSYEVFIPPDKDLANNLRGGSGMQAAWGGVYNKKPLNRTFIIRVGLFDKFAGGLPEYAYKENRERRLSIAKELFQNYPDLDGLCYSIRSHSLPCGGSKDKVGKFAYGFNEPIVKAYKNKYGIDITKEDYDADKFLEIRGNFFTGFLREVGAFVHSKGKKFEVMAPVHDSVPFHDHGAMYKLWEGINIDNFFQIRKWAKEGIVDTVIMLGTTHNMPHWPSRWDKEISAFKAKLKGTKTKLALHYLVNSGTKTDFKRILPSILKNPNLDEIEFYEEHAMYVRKLYTILEDCLKNNLQ
jgi:hypothetical protein